MSEFNKMWCLEYDENSYYQTLSTLQFSKFLTCVFSNYYYPEFQKQIFKQIQDPHEWTQQSWSILSFFQSLNEVFQFSRFQQNVAFIPASKARKVFGSFRLWIDTQRLYLATFLKLDKIQFQQDRIFFAIYRTISYLKQFLQVYAPEDFNNQYLKLIKSELNKHCRIMSNCFPKKIVQYVEEIMNIWIGFENQKNPINNMKIYEELKKTIFVRLSREYEMMPDIEQRLQNNINFYEKKRINQEIIHNSKKQAIINHGNQVRELYDPIYREMTSYKKTAEMDNKVFDQQLVREEIYKYLNKEKKSTTTNQYQNLDKVRHNPYENSNYVLYGALTGVDPKEKEDLQKQNDDTDLMIEQEENTEQKKYIRNLIKTLVNKEHSSYVTEDDLRKDIKQFYRYNRRVISDTQGKVSKGQWDRQSGQLSSNRNKVTQDQLSTLNTLNSQKDLQKNVLFKKCQEIQEEEKKKIKNLDTPKTNKILSNTLNNSQLKSEKIYSGAYTYGNELLFSLMHRCTLDRSKFDSMRKVIQVYAAIKKIDKYMAMDEVPDFYPRGIQEVKQYETDMMNNQRKKNMAITVSLLEQ